MINYLDDLLNIILVSSVLKTFHETWLNSPSAHEAVLNLVVL
jgi:hypothetical protein